MTNYERMIKNLSIEELASKLDELSDIVCSSFCSCERCPFNFSDDCTCTYSSFYNWLKEEVEK